MRIKQESNIKICTYIALLLLLIYPSQIDRADNVREEGYMLEPINQEKLKQQLTQHEGLKLKPYKDSEGYLTIGVGHLIDERRGGGISKDTAMFILNEDIAEKIADLDRMLPWWRNLNEVRQRVMVNLCFNLGISGLLQFRNTLKLLESGNYEEAAKHLLDSKAAKQTGNRYHQLAEMIARGTDLEQL